jgi:hypothetical protein
VLSREFLGAVLRCQIRTPGGLTVVADLHKPTARDAATEDTPMRFAVDPGDVRLFPVEAGQ